MSLTKSRIAGREEASSVSQQALNLSAVKKIDASTDSRCCSYWQRIQERSCTEGPLFAYKR